MLKNPFVPITLILALTTVACGAPKRLAAPGRPFPRQETITAIKDFEKTVGFQETKNFLTYADAVESYYRCYYTGKLELPASYEELQLARGNEEGCALDEEKYDIFFYPIEAVANGNIPVTSSLAKASEERLLVVVLHEDFHEQKQVQKLPPTITEAAATLIGFLTASEFAQTKLGVMSETYQNLSSEAGLFLQKAEIVNDYHVKLSSLYTSVSSGNITARNALAVKERLLTQMQEECKAIMPDPSSFNKCPAANNNAGLAFDVTYTKYYPLLYELFLAQGRDLRTTIETIKQITRPLPKEDAIKYFQNSIQQHKETKGSSR